MVLNLTDIYHNNEKLKTSCYVSIFLFQIVRNVSKVDDNVHRNYRNTTVFEANRTFRLNSSKRLSSIPAYLTVVLTDSFNASFERTKPI